MLKVVVNKATPTYTLPVSISATYGQKLSDLNKSLPVPKGDQTPGTWAWIDESQSVGDVTGTGTEFGVKFTPGDRKNYEELNKTITVIVNPATPEASDFDFKAPSDPPHGRL